MKRHLKRIAAPATWNVKRRSTTFITKPFPSGHALHHCLPLNVFLQELGGYAKSTKEVKNILRTKEILVNGRRRQNYRDAVGFLDLVQIGDANERVRIIINKKGKIGFVKIPAQESNIIICKIIGKTILTGKKHQLHLNNGQNYLVAENNKYHVGDSVVIDLQKNTLVDHLPFGKNMIVFLLAGKQIGHVGMIVAIEGRSITLSLAGNVTYKTTKENVFVVGKDHPIITVEDKIENKKDHL